MKTEISKAITPRSKAEKEKYLNAIFGKLHSAVCFYWEFTDMLRMDMDEGHLNENDSILLDCRAMPIKDPLPLFRINKFLFEYNKQYAQIKNFLQDNNLNNDLDRPQIILEDIQVGCEIKNKPQSRLFVYKLSLVSGESRYLIESGQFKK